jgi:hypothetical protein
MAHKSRNQQVICTSTEEDNKLIADVLGKVEDRRSEGHKKPQFEVKAIEAGTGAPKAAQDFLDRSTLY